MSKVKLFASIGSICLVVAAACGAAPAGATTQEKTPEAAAQEQRLALLKAKGAKAPIAVYPLLFAGNPNQQVGEALGLVLEQQGGFDDISMASGEFKPPADATPATIAPLFGEFVRKNPAGGDFALLAKFTVEKNRFTAVRAWIVDRDGALVWADAQKSGDAAFDRNRPGEPLECCGLVAERLRSAVGVAKPAKEREGPMARLWAAKSGTPTEAERNAMAERAKALQKAGEGAKIVVFPVRIAGELDVAQGAALAKLLGGACAATASDVQPAFDSKPTGNQQRTLWDLARGFQAHLAKHPVDADYALIAEYVTSKDRKQIGGVDFVVCTGKGEWVVADFQNSHHDDWQSIAPASCSDCDRLVLKRMEHYLR